MESADCPLCGVPARLLAAAASRVLQIRYLPDFKPGGVDSLPKTRATSCRLYEPSSSSAARSLWLGPSQSKASKQGHDRVIASACCRLPRAADEWHGRCAENKAEQAVRSLGGHGPASSKALTNGCDESVGNRRNNAGHRDRHNPSPNNTTRHAPTNRRKPLHGAYPDDGARNGVRGADGD